MSLPDRKYNFSLETLAPVKSNLKAIQAGKSHPLEIALSLAIEQATKGKGERHGGDSVPFYEQQWVMLAKHHGIGFLTGQAAKKLNEAAQKIDPVAWEREVLGAIVYAGMAILAKRGYPNGPIAEQEEIGERE